MTISELSNAHARALWSIAPDAAFVITSGGIVEAVSPGVTAVLGYRRDEIVGSPIGDWVDPADRARAWPGLAQCVAQHRGSTELRCRHRNGGYRTLRFPLAQRPRGAGLYAVGQDLTEQRALDATLDARTADLAVVQDELDGLAYAVSHDLRAPLRSLDGFSQTLLREYGPQLDDRGRDRLERIEGAATRLRVRIDGILQLSRIGRAELRPQTVDLSAIARTVAAELAAADPARAVEFQIADGLAAWGDRALVQAVLERLLHNAWKFTAGRTPAEIAVAQGVWQEQPAFLVQDNGVGFDMTYADKLFGAFQRLHAAEEFAGTGIGLAIVRRIIARHGGEVGAEASLEAGACFYFTLPSSQGEELARYEE